MIDDRMVTLAAGGGVGFAVAGLAAATSTFTPALAVGYGLAITGAAVVELYRRGGLSENQEGV